MGLVAVLQPATEAVSIVLACLLNRAAFVALPPAPCHTGDCMQSLSLFSLLMQARCMMEVLSLSHGVPAGCNGRYYERRDGHYVFFCVMPSFPSRGSRKRHRATADPRGAPCSEDRSTSGFHQGERTDAAMVGEGIVRARIAPVESPRARIRALRVPCRFRVHVPSFTLCPCERRNFQETRTPIFSSPAADFKRSVLSGRLAASHVGRPR